MAIKNGGEDFCQSLPLMLTKQNTFHAWTNTPDEASTLLLLFQQHDRYGVDIPRVDGGGSSEVILLAAD